MNIKTTLVTIAIGLALTASASGESQSPITQRQAAMKAIGGEMRTLGGMAQGKTAYDDFAVLSSLDIMRNAASTARQLFPVGSGTGEKTRAKPEIWAANSDFDARLGHLIDSIDTALAAEPADLASYRPLFGAIAQNCKGCHEKYRAPKN